MANSTVEPSEVGMSIVMRAEMGKYMNRMTSPAW
jgi:hypothetical protein